MTTHPPHPRSVFDELTGAGAAPTVAAASPAVAPGPGLIPGLPGGPPGIGTPARVKQAIQELLRLGVLYAEAKPNLYQAVLANRPLVAAILEPLDFALRIDEVRAMVILTVAPALRGEGEGEPAGGDPATSDGWQHPLVRRQRLTLAQSLLLAILRRRYVEHEKTASGAAPPRVPVEELVPELAIYLGDEGSDAANESRLRRLLEQLREHGIVSPVDDDDQVTIRPLICHLADPTTLQLLLAHYTRLAGVGEGGGGGQPAEGVGS